MMWEESRGSSSPWSGYLQDMPTSFDTLMFWTQQELEELQGSTIRDKIGKEEAEKDYHEKVLPILQRRHDIFDPNFLDTFFSLQRFHINGSRILSRSFQVEDWQDDNASDESRPEEQEENDEDEENPPQLIAAPLSQQGDVEAAPNGPVGLDEDEDEDDERDGVSMVPMADILNARYGCNNAKLFYEKEHLRMVAVRDINAGEQIWNTYGDPPNADLLRRYGYIDVIPFHAQAQSRESYESFPYENPSDEVEIRADLVFDVCAPGTPESEKTEKIEVWLNLGGDDTFVIDRKDGTCKLMLGMIHYLSMTPQEVEETIEKDKLPKGKPTGDTLKLALQVLRTRLAQYTTTLEEDEILLKATAQHYGRMFSAVFVRLWEKRLLRGAIRKMEEILQQEEEEMVRRSNTSTSGRGKRPREETSQEHKASKKRTRR
ncbi:hypothetical protein FRB91_006486 [Serendipita sp. 411]|nr:hypothetical protein FRB91_006486 [Serendipita sp. 411]